MLTNNFYKIYFLLSIIALLGLVSCDNEKHSFKINGKLENTTNGYFLIVREIRDSVTVDTVAFDEKGKFSYKGDIESLSIVSLYFNNNSKYSYILADKGWNIELTGDVLYPDLIEVKGGEVNEHLSAFKRQNKDVLKRRVEILDFVKDSDAVSDKNHLMDLKNINFELSNIAAEYVKENPDKISSVVLINAFFKDETAIPRLDDCLSLLRGSAADHPFAKNLTTYSNKVKKAAEGANAPDFSRKDTNDKLRTLFSFRGKYLLLTFVSTTCPLCEVQRPELTALYNKFKKDKINIEFLTIVIDTEEEPLPSDVKSSIKWPIITEDGGWSADILNTYNVDNLPFYTLISPSGVILKRDIPLSMIEEAMLELTNKE